MKFGTITIGYVCMHIASIRLAIANSATTVRDYRLELHNNQVSHNEAKTDCESRGAWLVEIKDKEIGDAVETLAPTRNDADLTLSKNKNHVCVRRGSSDWWLNVNCNSNLRYICQSDTTYPGSFNLTVKDQEMNFQEAKANCQTDGATLIDIKTTELNMFAVRTVSGKIGKYWTGGSNIGHTGSYKWGDGTVISDNNPGWYTGRWIEPNNKHQSNFCVAIYIQSGWKGWTDVRCSTQAYQICQKSRIFFASGYCKYHVKSDQGLKFPNANDTCQALNGSLVMIKSLSLQDQLKDQIIKQYDNKGGIIEFWLGGYRSNGTWLWMDGSKIPSTGPNQNWRTTQRQYMILSSYGTTWNDMRWWSKNNDREGGSRGFICEVAVDDPCKAVSCGSHGPCVSTGCQANCRCNPGYFGNVCQNESLKIVADRDTYTALQGQNVTVQIYVESHDGAVTIKMLNNSDTYHNVKNSVNITIGPLLNQTKGDIYLLRATPESVKSPYFKYLDITIRVEGPPTVSLSVTELVLPVEDDGNIVVCEATGVPKPYSTWIKDGKEVSNSSISAVYQEEMDYSSQLHFSREAREVGLYTCLVQNTVFGQRRRVNASIFVQGQITGEKHGLLSTTAVVSIVLAVVLVAIVIGGIIYRKRFMRNFQHSEQETQESSAPIHDFPSNYENVNLPVHPGEHENRAVTYLPAPTTSPISRLAESPGYEEVRIDTESGCAEYEVPQNLQAKNLYEVCM